MSTEPDRVLVVDDDTSILAVLKTLLTRDGFEVVTADSSDKGLNILRREYFDLLLSDIVMQPFDGITLLQQAKRANPDIQVIMMTGFASIETANKAMKLGAFDYICKPFKIDELKETIKRAVTYLRRSIGEEEEVVQKKVTLVKRHFNEFVGDSPRMRQVYDTIAKFIDASNPVLIVGESGTGKSAIAKILRANGSRNAAPFLTFNCTVHPESLLDEFLFGYVQLPTDDEGNVIKGLPVVNKGVFERAKGGIVFFEEISALPLLYQEKLLRVIQERKVQREGSDREFEVDIHVIADTTVSLQAKVKRQEFVEELYLILQGHTIEAPPLQQHSEDIALLINYNLIKYNKQENSKVAIGEKAHKAMERYTWPGNVRELENSIYRSAKHCKREKIQLSDLPVPVRMCCTHDDTSVLGYSEEIDLRWWSLKKFMKAKEREYVDQVLKATKGDKEKAAKMLGMNLATFYRKYGKD